MTIAESRAMEAYPPIIDVYPRVPTSTCIEFKPAVTDHNAYNRAVYIDAYRQAEKDNELTADDIKRIIQISSDIIFGKNDDSMKCGDVASEVLKRFNETRRKL